ncbi:MAG: hypothetical protein HUU08_05010 [Candidatus Brocadia sp.]|nr:hypothetical protein [Candidatus Brocadia sp.]
MHKYIIPALICLTITIFLYNNPTYGWFWDKNKTIEGEIDGKKEKRILRDCDKEIEYQGGAFSLKVNVLDKIDVGGSVEKKKIRDVSEVLEVLQMQSRELCKDWNTFAVTREEYNRKADWIRNAFTSFMVILNSIKLTELEDPNLKKEFLQKLFSWFDDAVKKNDYLKEKFPGATKHIEQHTSGDQSPAISSDGDVNINYGNK